MSTLSGIASKGEKGKSKFQSLDINSLYRGESLEPNQQKSTLPRCKYGMQSLGKVPSARRPPANLPSLKSESSGSDPAVSLVPTGGAGWGNKPGDTPPPSTTPTSVTSTASNASQSTAPSQIQPQVTHTVTQQTVQPAPPPQQQQQQQQPPLAIVPPILSQPTLPIPGQQQQQQQQQQSQAPPQTQQPQQQQAHNQAGDKSWSSVMAGETGGHPPSFLAHQSPLFQQEFPKLSSGDGQAQQTGQKGGSDTQYGPGPSLRPQTEGSWIQGGSRASQGASLVQGPLPHMPPPPHGVDLGGGRNNLGPHPPPGVPMGPGGPVMPHGPPIHMPPPGTQFRGMPFMYRGNFPPPPAGFANYQRQRFPGYPPDSRFMPPRPTQGAMEGEEITRPIIKEEELNHMDNLARDTGWAGHDDIDYNQKLAFSDNEDSTHEDDVGNGNDGTSGVGVGTGGAGGADNDKDDHRSDDRHDKRSVSGQGWQQHSRNDYRISQQQGVHQIQQQQQQQHRPPQQQANRDNDDEIWKERRRVQTEEVALAVERAKQRKEEEEKRYEETKRAAAKKLQLLEQKINSNKNTGDGGKEHDEPNNRTPTTVIPLPDWAGQRERSRTNSEGVDTQSQFNVHSAAAAGGDKTKRDAVDRDFNQRRMDRTSDKNSRQYPTNLPPRLLKQQAERNQSAPAQSSSNQSFIRSSGSPQPAGGPSNTSGFDSRWMNSGGADRQNRSSAQQSRRFNSESADSNVDDRDRRDRRTPDTYHTKSNEYTAARQYSRDYDNRKERESDHERSADDWEGKESREGSWQEDRKIERESEKEELLVEEKREGDNSNSAATGGVGAGGGGNRRVERPQRPDSRDSRTSRESRNSRDSNRDDKHDSDHGAANTSNRSYNTTWTFKDDKKKHGGYREDRDNRRDNRHAPGPITREKLEAAERIDNKRSLTQLKRSSQTGQDNVNKNDCNTNSNNVISNEPNDESTSSAHSTSVDVKQDSTTAGSVTAVSVASAADSSCAVTSSTDKSTLGGDDLTPGSEVKDDGSTVKRDKGGVKTRGSGRGQSDYNRNRSNTYSVYPSKVDRRRRDRDWGNRFVEMDYSGDESGGKDDNRRFHNKKPPSKKLEKDERNKETRKSQESGNVRPSYQSGNTGSGSSRYDKKNEVGGHRDGFTPCGQPTRNGRGSLRIRGNVGKRIGYGPPSSKSPFGTHSEEKKTSDDAAAVGEQVDDIADVDKNKPQADVSTSGGSAAGSRPGKTSIPPRMQKKSESDTRDKRKPGSGGGGGGRRNPSKPLQSNNEPGDDAWETTSETSEGDERKQGGDSKRNIGGCRSYGNWSDRPARQSNNNKPSGSRGPGPIKQDVKDAGAAKSDVDNNDGKYRDRNKKYGKDNVGRPDNGSKPPRINNINSNSKDRSNRPPVKTGKESTGTHSLYSSTDAPLPLMSKLVQAPTLMNNRARPNKQIPPRFAKQREVRLQNQMNDVCEINKINQDMNMLQLKDGSSVPSSINAWNKPIASSLRPNSPPTTSVGCVSSALPTDQTAHCDNSSQRSSPCGAGAVVTDSKVNLDGSTPPVNTIIFENTNYKSTPPGDMALKAKYNTASSAGGIKVNRMDKCRGGSERKMSDDNEDSLLSYKNPNVESKPVQPDTMSMSLYTNKQADDNVDMQLDFALGPDLSQLTDDKGSSKNMRDLARSMQIAAAGQHSVISPSAELNRKIASVKTVWDRGMPSVAEHPEDGTTSFTTGGIDPTGGVGLDDGGEAVYCPTPQMQVNSNYAGVSSAQVVGNLGKSDNGSPSSNVCEVKPQRQAVLSSGHSPLGHTGQSPMTHSGPLSPQAYNAVGTAPPSQFNYQQAGLSGTSAQYTGMSAIPSPPTVVYNSSGQSGMYQAFQIEGGPVLSGQARSSYSQYYNLSQGIGQSSAFNQQSMYLHQSAPQAAPGPEMYQSSMSQYRLQPSAPYGQNQQMSNSPNTVLISSASNSLMSASVKPSSQQISAIGTKGASPFQPNTMTSAPQPPQFIIPYDQMLSVNPSYLSASIPRGGPVQQSSSFYSSGNSVSAQTGFFQAPGSTLQQQAQTTPMQPTAYSLQGYNTQTPGLQNFSSQMGAQQFRTTATYLKSGMTPQHPSDLNLGQKNTSTTNQADVLSSSVFSSTAPQIPSPSRPSKQMNQQQPVPQHSPTLHQQQTHKFNPYQNVSTSSQLGLQQRVNQNNVSSLPNVRSNHTGGGGGSGTAPRYPSPIQRPVSYQHGNNNNGNRYRQQQVNSNTRSTTATSNKPYYVTQDTSSSNSMKLDDTSDIKTDDSHQLNCDEPVSATAAVQQQQDDDKSLTPQ